MPLIVLTTSSATFSVRRLKFSRWTRCVLSRKKNPRRPAQCPDNWPSGWDRKWCAKCAKHPKICKRLSRGKRQEPPQPLDEDDEVNVSIDATFCKEQELYTPERLKIGRNSLCCLSGFQTFRENARAQGGGGAAGRELFRSAGETCCDQFILQSSGTDALQKLCPYQKLG